MEGEGEEEEEEEREKRNGWERERGIPCNNQQGRICSLPLMYTSQGTYPEQPSTSARRRVGTGKLRVN